MKFKSCLIPILFFAIVSCTTQKPDGVLKRNEINPRYLDFRGKPVILMGSTEHYGALLNLDFDYVQYFDELQRCGLNLTRTFTGIYVEPEGAFNIINNTLAPANGRLITPFARSNEPGYTFGGNKFDLSRWDENYFERLKDFVEQADKRDIIVEITLFSSIYDESHWQLSPLYPGNNTNNLPDVSYNQIHSLEQLEYLAIQERMVKKLVQELNHFENIYYEIFNEPYADDISIDWHHHIARLVVETEKSLPKKHLISWNYQNNSGYIKEIPSEYSMINFHYAEPEAVTENYHLNVPIGDNETGFKGNANWPYRVEAWAFMLAGGALFNHLDYSFAVGYESGNFNYPHTQPGGGNAELRMQLGFLRKYLQEMGFYNLKANTSFVKSVSDTTVRTQVFALNDSIYNVYLYKKWSYPNENISVRFTGDFVPPSAGEYTFTTVSDDGIRLWVNNHLIIDNWTDHAAETDIGSITLEAEEKVPVKVEYYNGLYGGSIQVSWNNQNTPRTLLDSSYVSISGNDTPGFYTEYYTGRNFEKFERSDIQYYIDHEVMDFVVADGGYQNLSAAITTELSEGSYEISWIDPRNGVKLSGKSVIHPGGDIVFESHSFDYDALLVVRKVK
jgi:hypothetical protein